MSALPPPSPRPRYMLIPKSLFRAHSRAFRADQVEAGRRRCFRVARPGEQLLPTGLVCSEPGRAADVQDCSATPATHWLSMGHHSGSVTPESKSHCAVPSMPVQPFHQSIPSSEGGIRSLYPCATQLRRRHFDDAVAPHHSGLPSMHGSPPDLVDPPSPRYCETMRALEHQDYRGRHYRRSG